MKTPVDVDPAREEQELREYLGAGFDLDRLHNYQDTLDDEFEAAADEQRFYRTSNAYLYNLTAFAMTRTKIPYLRRLAAEVPPGARLLDYGCGIGSDGLALLEAGYKVEFADFANPSTEYLRWRLGSRGFDAPVHDLDDHVPTGFDAVFAFDVIEHVDDPFGFLAEMEARARFVVVNFLAPEAGDQELHHHLPIRELVDHAAGNDLRLYEVLHRRSHLVIYAPGKVSAAKRAQQRATARAIRLRHSSPRAVAPARTAFRALRGRLSAL